MRKWNPAEPGGAGPSPGHHETVCGFCHGDSSLRPPPTPGNRACGAQEPGWEARHWKAGGSASMSSSVSDWPLTQTTPVASLGLSFPICHGSSMVFLFQGTLTGWSSTQAWNWNSRLPSWLCDLEQVSSLLWALVSPSAVTSSPYLR